MSHDTEVIDLETWRRHHSRPVRWSSFFSFTSALDKNIINIIYTLNCSCVFPNKDAFIHSFIQEIYITTDVIFIRMMSFCIHNTRL